MRIAMIGLKGIPAKWGGIEKYVEAVGERLARRGHRVTVFASGWYCSEYPESHYRGIRIRRVPTIRRQATDALSNAFWASLMASMGPFEVVNFHGYASYYFVPFVRRFGKIAVVTAHGIESGWDNPKYGTAARGILKRAFRIGVTRADAVTTVAHHLKVDLEQRYKIDCRLLPSGIEIPAPAQPRIIRAKYDLKGMDYVLFLGRIDPIKRVDWVVDLMGGIEASVKIVVAGGAQDRYTCAYLERMIGRAGSNRRVIFTGPVDGAEKSELLGNCRLFLAPSSYEGLPIALLEAMAHGRCCVASDIKAHREIIRNGETGYLFPSGDKVAFERLVDRVAKQPASQLRHIGKESEMYVSTHRSWETTSGGFEQLMRSLVKNESRP